MAAAKTFSTTTSVVLAAWAFQNAMRLETQSSFSIHTHIHNDYERIIKLCRRYYPRDKDHITAQEKRRRVVLKRLSHRFLDDVLSLTCASSHAIFEMYC